MVACHEMGYKIDVKSKWCEMKFKISGKRHVSQISDEIYHFSNIFSTVWHDQQHGVSR